MYGKELILDIHNCDKSIFKKNNREFIEEYFKELCKLIDMEREDLHFWDYYAESEFVYEREPDHLKGTSAIQFIRTSNITIHTLDTLRKVFINIFSCKDFDSIKAAKFTEQWFRGEIITCKDIERV